MRGEKLGHLLTTGMIKRKQHEKMLDRLPKWLKVGRVTEALKEKRDRDELKVMTA